MDSSSIELPGSEIDSITLQAGRLRLHFSRAYIVKTMTGSVEHTRWWQAGDLVIEGAEVGSEIPAAPLVCDGGDIDDNVFTYRDMIPIPFDSRGRIGCDLRFRGSGTRLTVTGETIRMEMVDVPKYIEHVRPGGA
jgi:hypothetical protein